jgi:hypothetical protein
MALSSSQLSVANQIYSIAYNEFVRLGFSTTMARQRAIEMIAAAYRESGLNPRAVNSSSGAAGLFQLLSSGYRTAAIKCGTNKGLSGTAGLWDIECNTRAILSPTPLNPGMLTYSAYWKQNPNAPIGAGGSGVERSGQPASWYAYPITAGILPKSFQLVGVGTGVGTGAGSTAPPFSGSPDQTGSAAELQSILRGFGLSPTAFGSIIDQAVRENWTVAQFESAIYQSAAFKNAFPGIFRGDGSLRMSPLEYRSLTDTYRKIGADFGIGLRPERIGVLIAGGVSPDEWANRAEIFSSVILGEDLGLRNNFNAVLTAAGYKPMKVDEWFMFLMEKPAGELYDLYEAATFRDEGFTMKPGQALRVAEQIGRPGEFVDLPALVQAARAKLDFIRPELAAAGITDSDLLIMESGEDPAKKAPLLEQILRNRANFAASARPSETPVAPGRVGVFAAPREGL